MSELFIEDYIDKLIMLEERLGDRTSYEMLQPFSLDGRDPIAIQRAARRIAEFIGLHGLVFIVATAKQQEGVGGHVELEDRQREVFVEISDDTAIFPAAFLATLAHEITHKYLHLNRISAGSGPIHQYHNEVLTDVAAVFLGLGKLILNGCEVRSTRQEVRRDGTYLVTDQLSTGYLDREQLAFVYRLVCAMRGILYVDMISSLSGEAILAIQACNSYQSDYFNEELHTGEYRAGLLDALKQDAQTLQREVKQLDRHLRFVRQISIPKTEGLVEVKREKISYLLRDVAAMAETETFDPCLRFLHTIALRETIAQTRGKTEKDISDVIDARQRLNRLTKLEKEDDFAARKDKQGRVPAPKRKSFLRRVLRGIFR